MARSKVSGDTRASHNKGTKVHTDIPPEVHLRLRQYVASQGTTISAFVRDLVVSEVLSKTPDIAHEIQERAYTLASKGIAWDIIASRTRLAPSAAQQAAECHATRNQLDWPPDRIMG